MAHYPLNHHLRRTYRFLAALTSIYLLAAGIIGLARTWGDPFFHRGSDWALGLRFNPAAAWLITILAAVLLAAILLGGNLYHQVTLVLGYAICAISMLVMAFLQTDANILNASMINVIVLSLLGVLILTAGLYGKVGSRQAAHDEAIAIHPTT
jgi:hypothetical protein